MTTESRRERERAQRHQLIITTARELAESEGWQAVTTRRLSQLIEYSQPVLYSHFAGMTAIVDAVAIEGCGELAEQMGAARRRGTDPRSALAGVAKAYFDFAAANPATFDALFNMPSGLPFGPDAPDLLKAAFAELRAVFAPLAREADDPEAITEFGWSALHGLVSLQRMGRLREDLTEQRFTLFLDRFAGAA